MKQMYFYFYSADINFFDFSLFFGDIIFGYNVYIYSNSEYSLKNIIIKQFDNVYPVLASYRQKCLYLNNIIGVVYVWSIHTFRFISPMDDFKKYNERNNNILTKSRSFRTDVLFFRIF